MVSGHPFLRGLRHLSGEYDSNGVVSPVSEKKTFDPTYLGKLSFLIPHKNEESPQNKTC